MITPVYHINNQIYSQAAQEKVTSSAHSAITNSTKNTNELDRLAQMNKMQVSFSGVDKPGIDYFKHKPSNYKGCMLGFAIGDAIGNPVEYEKYDRIREFYGKDGVTDIIVSKGVSEITEETQLSIFTADGIIKSAIKNQNDDALPDLRCIYESYQDWFQGQTSTEYKPTAKGWISNILRLQTSKNPEIICTNALTLGMPGSIEFPINNRKDGDGVMRTGPIGLKYYKKPEIAFEAGARCVALTHGSPSAYLPGGVYACMIANIVQGKKMDVALNNTMQILKKYKGHEDTLALLEKAKRLAASPVSEKTAIKRIGEGWNADEAIAIGVYCALKSPENFRKAVLMSVNHNGNSNSTASITGGIVGTYVGEENIPQRWKDVVELHSELSELSLDLFTKSHKIKDAKTKYPVKT